MPYDPTLPVNGDIVDADELRAQFQGLKELIDAVPAGPMGPAGLLTLCDSSATSV